MSEHTEHGGVDYEREDVNPAKILAFTGIVVVFIAAMLVFLAELFMFEKENQVADVFLKPESVQLRELRAQDMQVLTGYKIIDAEKGIYQIPIAEAMKKMVDEAYVKSQKK